jgi:hydrogenase expression/formation protein HypC
MEVLRVEGLQAWCRDRDGSEVVVDTILTGPVSPGQWLLVFLGAAREIVSAEDAAKVSAAIDALDAALVGDTDRINAAFADLIDREPQLPDFLRKDA